MFKSHQSTITSAIWFLCAMKSWIRPVYFYCIKIIRITLYCYRIIECSSSYNHRKTRWLFCRLNSKIKNEWRCILCWVFFPFLILYLVYKLWRKGFEIILKYPNGLKKRSIWVLFLIMAIFWVIVLISIIVITSLTIHYDVMDEYIIKLAYTGYQNNADAVAKFK